MNNLIKSFAFLALLTASGVALCAQPADAPVDTNASVTLVLPPLDRETQNVVSNGATTPVIVNVMTVIGAVSTGVPCFDCVTSATSPNIGIVQPSGVIQRGGAASQINAFLFDQNYTGSCTFRIEIVDASQKVVASTRPRFSYTAPTSFIISTTLAIPSTAAIGIGHVQTVAVCGTSITKSASPVLISE